MAGTNRNRTDWAILCVFIANTVSFYDKKQYIFVIGVWVQRGGWLPRNGSIIEQIWSNQQLLIDIGQIGPMAGIDL